MSGYRFCRTDDIPLLVEAYNSCYAVHFDDEPPLTVGDLKRKIRELNLWSSSCMVALAGDEPVGVLLATKRDCETLIHRVGVRADQQRRGHGHHLLDSLSQKLTILGPPRLVVEIPTDWSPARSFFEYCGYRPETNYADFVLDRLPPPVDAGELAIPITLDELLESGAWDRGVRRSWERSLETLTNRKEQIEGLAAASDERIEAYLLHRPNAADGSREIVAFGSVGGEQFNALLGILVRHLSRQESSALVVPRISPEEVSYPVLESWGFRKRVEYVGYAALAGTRTGETEPATETEGS